jgi:phthalate 4,5-cis-dihydrodiol dehydrogenase
MTSSTGTPIRAGIAGLGMAGAGIVAQLSTVPGVEMVAAADPRENALGAFKESYRGRTYPGFEALCEDPEVDAVWVATPSHLHCEHVVRLAESGKHIVVEKPMAVSLEECAQMVEAAEKNGVTLIAGGARSFDPAFVAMSRIIRSGRLGKLGALTTWALTGWMTRAREPHELDPQKDGGCIFNQGPHAVDVLRLLGGGMVRSVAGSAVDLNLPGRPGAGYFTSLLEFEDGTPATLVYDGYGYVQGWELVPWGETPQRVAASDNGNAYRRQLRAGTADEITARERLRFGGRTDGGPPFGRGDGNWTPMDAGLVIAVCELGEVRQSATGLYVYDDDGRHDEAITPGGSGRENEVADLRRGIEGGRPLHDGRWGMASMEVVLAIAESAREHKQVMLSRQVPAF